MNMGFIVAIDGPAGSGKGTITKLIAEKRNLVSIDTGAMYRCVTLDCLNKGIEPNNIEGIKSVLENINIELTKVNGEQKVILNGKDVSREIREPRVNEAVSPFSAIKEVRDIITPMQRKMAEKQDIIMEGRDIGTVVFPNADVKIFLDVSLEESARRRYKQNIENGIETTYENELEKLKQRNKYDSERDVVPFIKAEDAILVDSTNMSIDEVVETILKIIDEKLEK